MSASDVLHSADTEKKCDSPGVASVCLSKVCYIGDCIIFVKIQVMI